MLQQSSFDWSCSFNTSIVPDNSPPGAGTAYDCGYGRGFTAGGDGSYSNPHTFATAPGEFDKCEIIWDPYTKKYLIFQDTCAACTTDWKKGIHHIDLWLGSTTKNWHNTVIKCERALTPSDGQAVLRDPSKHLDADSELQRLTTSSTYAEPLAARPLFHDGVCHTERVYPQ
jgi:hypothetical protein